MFGIQPLREGEDFPLERTSRKRRLSLEAGSERCFFFITSSVEILKICKVSMERKTVPISLPVFWPFFSVKAFYKARGSPNFDSKRLIILSILHLDSIFVIAHSQEKIMVARNAFIFLLQNSGFSINVKKSVLQSKVFGSNCGIQRTEPIPSSEKSI